MLLYISYISAKPFVFYIILMFVHNKGDRMDWRIYTSSCMLPLLLTIYLFLFLFFYRGDDMTACCYCKSWISFTIKWHGSVQWWMWFTVHFQPLQLATKISKSIWIGIWWNSPDCPVNLTFTIRPLSAPAPYAIHISKL